MRKLIPGLLLLFITIQVIAQNRAVTGTVTAKDDGLPIPGVSVKVKGTNTGTQTGSDGKYSINVPTAIATLEFSFIGYATQEVVVGANNNINVIMETDIRQLGEVVITALGITREKKTLGYSTTTVNTALINNSSAVNLFGGLQGKVAGVNISNTSGAPGGSTKVIIRGYHSINSNGPLYVIDGVPLNNSRPGSDDNFDFGNNANDINPNEIDNMSILKGSAATALYGSRGANGVVLITTKKGKAGIPKVEFNSGTTITTLGTLYTPQKTFGQGWDAYNWTPENGNWGPKYDGQVHIWGAVVDNSQLLKPYSFIENNIKDAYDRGIELNNSISLSGGNESSTYHFAYGNVLSDGILPGDNDSYKKNDFNIKGSTKYKGFSADASFNYVGKNSKRVETGQGPSGIGDTFYEDILQIPLDIPIKDLHDYTNKFFNVDSYFTPYAENPYYILAQNGSKFKSDRVYGNINLGMKANDWLSFQLQQGADITQSGDRIWHNVNNPAVGSWNAGGNTEGQTRSADVGNTVEESQRYFEYDTKLNALFKKTLSSSFDIDGLIGTNFNDRGSRLLSTSVEGLAIPGFFQLSNSANKPRSSESDSHRRLLGAYAQATLGFKSYLYLTLSGRNDWSSTLPKGKNSFFYPGANVAFILSQALNMNSSSALSFAKLRASYGQTGSDTDPYRISNVINATNIGLGFGNILFPINNVAGFSISNQLNNQNLRPEITTEYELGGELRFLNDRIGIDANYYHKITSDQIIPVAISPAAGYTSIILNATKVRNQGVEILFNATPVKSSSVNWNLSYTFARDRSMVLELAEGLEKLVLKSVYDAQLVAVKGQPLGIIQAPTASYDPAGHIIVDSKGYPVAAPSNKTFGSIQSDYQMGLQNSLSYKNLSLGFSLDYRKGGVFYSGTADLLNFVGADIKTTYNDRRPFIVPNSVQAVTDAAGNVTGYVENTVQITEPNVDDYYYPTNNKALAYDNRILDKTYLKLREVTLSYALPTSLAAKIRADKAVISLYGRNLYTWLGKGNRTVDPEVSNLGNDISSELGEFRTAPPVRFFGASLKLSF